MTEIDNSSPRKLNDKELLSRTKILVSEERELLTRVLRHLQEIDRRKLYLHIGYSSLWAYCTQELGYTEAAAQRRIEAMRALREYPALEAKIENGALSLSAIAKVQSLVRRVNKSPKVDNARLTVSSEEKLELVLALENKTQKESDEILAARFPEQIKKMEKVRPVSSEHFEVKFVATKEMMDKLDQVKSLLSHKNPNASVAELFEMMTDFVIRKKDPRKSAVRQAENPPRRLQTRYIPAPVRRKVWQAADGCCEYKDPNTGRRCGGRHKLEIEHVMPKAFGGTNDVSNLKLYCRAHNVLAAEEAGLIFSSLCPTDSG